MFQTLIVQPIFNLLVFVYALLPDFGIAIIVFTVIVRFLMWPLVKRQLHHARAMRELQPEIKKIREKTKGNKQKEAELLMELYKERQINPLGSIGIILIQLPILIGLFSGLNKLINDSQQIIDFSYSFLRNFGYMEQISADISKFDASLLNIIDLHRRAFEGGSIYWPLMVLALAASVFQFIQTRQLQPEQGERKTLRQILRDESKGKQAEQGEINAAVSRNMSLFFPVLTFFFTVSFPGALALYWATGSLIAIIQQRYILGKDVREMEEVVQTSNDPAPKKRRSRPKRKR